MNKEERLACERTAKNLSVDVKYCSVQGYTVSVKVEGTYLTSASSLSREHAKKMGKKLQSLGFELGKDLWVTPVIFVNHPDYD